MIIKNVNNINEIDIALRYINIKYNNNIIFKRLEEKVSNSVNKKTLTFNVILKVKNSKLSGARKSFSGRHLVSACWHVYADFLEELFKINSNIKITSCGKKIEVDNIRDNFRELIGLCECE